MIIIENPLKIKYKFVEFKIDKETIEEFQTMERARILRNEKVRELKSMIINGNHFDSPIIINDVKTKKRIIDGQHRINAIRQIIQENKNFVISVLLVVYQNLSKDEEKEMFTRWNSGTRQTGEDIIQIYTDEMPIYDMLKEKGLVSIYNEPGKVKFRNVVQPYLAAQIGDPMIHIYPRDFIEKAKRLGKSDADKIAPFIKELKENTEKERIFKRATGQAAITYCYFTNEKKGFWEKFKRVKKYKQVEEAAEHEGRVGICKLIHILNNKMFGTPIPINSSGLINIFTEDKIEWLRKNYPKSTWDRDDITQEFNEKYGTNVSAGTLGYYMSKNGIVKDESMRKRSILIYTKQVLDYMKECSKTMIQSEARKACELKFEHEFSPFTFGPAARKNNIVFAKSRDELNFKMNPKQKELIDKNRNKSPYEIKDIIIEKLGIEIPITAIKYELRNLGIEGKKEEIKPLSNKEINKKMRDIGSDDEEMELEEPDEPDMEEFE